MKVRLYDNDKQRSVELTPDVEICSNIVAISLALAKIIGASISDKELANVALEKNIYFLSSDGYEEGLQYLYLNIEEYKFRFGKRTSKMMEVFNMLSVYSIVNLNDDTRKYREVESISRQLSKYLIKRYYTKRKAPTDVFLPVKDSEYIYKMAMKYWNRLISQMKITLKMPILKSPHKVDYQDIKSYIGTYKDKLAVIPADLPLLNGAFDFPNRQWIIRL